MMKKEVLNAKRICSFFSVLLVIFLAVHFVSSQSLDVSTSFFKISVERGESAVKEIGITSSERTEIRISSEGITKGVSFEDNEVFFNSGEYKTINISFNSSELSEGAYMGKIVLNGKETKKIPFLFEVESKDLFFSSNVDIPPRYVEIESGGEMVAQIRVFNIASTGGLSDRLGPTSVQMTYSIFNLDGEKIYSETENLIVNNQAQITKSIKIPEKAKQGRYVFVVETEYKSSVGVSSSTFSVIKGEEGNFYSSIFSNSNLLWLLAVFLVLLIFLIYIIHERNIFLRELRKFHSEEMKSQKELLREQVRILQKKRGISREVVRKSVEVKVRELQNKQKERTEKIKELNKEGRKDEMQKQIEEWKRKGYGTLPLEYKLKGLSKREMKKILDGWKAKYKN